VTPLVDKYREIYSPQLADVGNGGRLVVSRDEHSGNDATFTFKQVLA
jgi:hypothetical protein